jgi:uncharacterized protein YggE
MPRNFILLTLISTGLALAQTTPNSITVTATRTVTAQPDQVVFQLSVTSPLTAGRDDVIAALQGTGITAANFTSMYTNQQYVNGQYLTALQWNFNLTAPLSNLKSTIDTFTGLQMSLAKGNTGMSLSFAVQALQVSPQAQQAQPCSLAGLISDARSQAQKIANAAAVTVGPVLAITNSISDTGMVACSATVKFALSGGF